METMQQIDLRKIPAVYMNCRKIQTKERWKHLTKCGFETILRVEGSPHNPPSGCAGAHTMAMRLIHLCSL